MKKYIAIFILILFGILSTKVFGNDTSIEFMLKETDLKDGELVHIYSVVNGKGVLKADFNILSDGHNISGQSSLEIFDSNSYFPSATFIANSKIAINNEIKIEALVFNENDEIIASETLTFKINMPTIHKKINPNGNKVLHVILNGEIINLKDSEMPIIENNNIMIPKSGLLEKMGFMANYISKYELIVIENNKMKLSSKIGDYFFNKSNKIYLLKTPMKLVDNNIFIPLDSISEKLGYVSNWIEDENVVEITLLSENLKTKNLLPINVDLLDSDDSSKVKTQIEEMDLVIPSKEILVSNYWLRERFNVLGDFVIMEKYEFDDSGNFESKIGKKLSHGFDFQYKENGYYELDRFNEKLIFKIFSTTNKGIISETKTFNIAYSRKNYNLYYFDSSQNKYILLGNNPSNVMR